MTESVEETPSESVPLTEPRLPVILVEANSELETLTHLLEAENTPLAIDAERASGFRYGQKAYLIQIGIRDVGIYLVDPVGDFESASWIRFTKATNSRPWIIHAATQDLSCLAEIGLTPSKILDTELASRLIGLPRVALGTITEHYLNLKLAKEHSAVDWSIRPLPQNWLDYAALDVDVLFDLWDAVFEDVRSQDKEDLIEQEFNHLLTPMPKEPKLERWRGTSGLHEIKDQRLMTIAKFIWEAREALAMEKDISPGRLIPDSAIIAVLKALPKTKSELSSLRTFSGRASRTFIDIWWKAYQEGLTTKHLVELRAKATGIPNHRNWPQKYPEAHARLLACKVVISEASEKTSIPPENLMSPEIIRALCFDLPTDLTIEALKQKLLGKRMRLWQVDLLVEGLAAALAAKIPEQTSAETDS